MNVLLIFVFLFAGSVVGQYRVSARRDDVSPFLSSQQNQSSFVYNYNTASFGQGKLLVRVQNFRNNNIYDTTASQLALVDLSGVVNVTGANVVFSPEVGGDDNFGVEDPRVVFFEPENTLLLTYTAAQQYANGSVVARLAMATSEDGGLNWKRLGVVFPQIPYSKSGAVFPDRKIMIFGDSSLVAGLQRARLTGPTLLNWTIDDEIFLPVRPDNFDSHLVEAGPPPIKLQDGNFLFIYNSARSGFPSPKPGYSLQYNLGFAIIDGQSGAILQRSSEPLLSPELPWELGKAPFLGLTPNVVFCNGMESLGGDSFVIYYGGADSVIGSATVIVEKEESK